MQFIKPSVATAAPGMGLRVVLVEGNAPLPGESFCTTPLQMNGFCDLLCTPDAPVSKIAPVKYFFM